MLFKRNIALIALFTSLFTAGIYAEPQQTEKSWLLDGPTKFVGNTCGDLRRIGAHPRKHIRNILKRRVRPSILGVTLKTAQEMETELEPEDILFAKVADGYVDRFIPSNIGGVLKQAVAKKMKSYTKDANTISEHDASWNGSFKRTIGRWGTKHNAGLYATVDAFSSQDGKFKKTFLKTFGRILAKEAVYTYGSTLLGYPGFLVYSPTSYAITNGLRWFARDITDATLETTFLGTYNFAFDSIYDTTASLCSHTYQSIFGSPKNTPKNPVLKQRKKSDQPKPQSHKPTRFKRHRNYGAALAPA